MLKSDFTDKLLKILVPLGVIFFLFVFIVSVIDTKEWVGRPFPGFLIYSNLTVAEEALSDWTGIQNGLRAFDKITEVNGSEVHSSKEVYDTASNLPLNTPIYYTVIRGSEVLEIPIPTMEFAPDDFLQVFGPIVTIGIVFFLIGLVVYYLKPNIAQSRVFFLFCYFLSLWFISSFDSHTNYFLDIESVVWMVVPPLFICMAFVFPSENRIFKRHSTSFVLLAFSVSVLLFVLQLIYYNSQIMWELINLSVWFYLLFGSLFLLISLLLTYLKPDSGLDKQRAQIVLLGSFIGFVIPAVGAVIAVIFNIGNITYLALPVILFPISIGYAIVKHKLFDIDVIIRKTIVYGTLTVVVVGVFTLMVMAFNLGISKYGGWKNPAFFVLLSVFVVVFLNPVKNRLQDFIDLTFFRKKYDYQKTIEEIVYAMSSLLNLNEINDRILDTIEQTMFSSRRYVILFNRDSGEYQAYTKCDNCDDLKRLRIEEDNTLIQILYKSRKEIFKEDIIADEGFIAHVEELMKIFKDFDAALFVPMFFKEQLIGVLSLGDKKSGLLYTSEDVKLLRTLANQSAIAIENAVAFKLVEDYVKKLEEANKELVETQAQLIRAEKMSAIGQLAAGIAHEIRNPLSIIEGARYYLAQTMEGENSPVTGEYLDYIKHEVERTNRFIDTLLQLSRSEAPDFEQLDVNSILENSSVLMRKQLSDNKINLVKNLSCDIPNILGDPNQLWQVFINIMINSIQALPDGGEIRIDTGLCKGSSDRIFISFSDTGLGISKEFLSNIFNPFFTTKSTGTGLGLSICNKIVEEHQGRILVSSEKGKGTTFMVELLVNPSIED